jgi:hypothetical protein
MNHPSKQWNLIFPYIFAKFGTGMRRVKELTL